MNPRIWLYILPLALVLLMFILSVFPKSASTTQPMAPASLKAVLVKEEVKNKEDIRQAKKPVLTDTSLAPPPPIDTLWKVFRRKPTSKFWKACFDIRYKHKGAYGYYPKFTAKHWKFHQKEIEVSGYMYPLDTEKKQTFFMLSFYPIQQCFFCGGAGPESIVEVNSPKGISLSSKRIKVKGKLRLNTKEPQRLFYILDDATEAR